ncbi:MAG: type II toxin-antitoxin system PemK/MazF family toxin [Actinomycetota bacterium]|nr:type II toxin-antitoxin system PemK/MazF family toxin [Actinomycetota bacterium]
MRGDIYELRLPKGSGHEQRGRRFGVVLQADEFLPRSVVVIAPTSRGARPASFRPEIEINKQSTRLLIEQLGAVDVGRLGKLVGHVTSEEGWEIDDSLMAVLGLR